MTQAYVYEVLNWKSLEGTPADEMIAAVTDFGLVISALPGFLHQALYQRDNGQWVDVYYWRRSLQSSRS